MLEVHQALGTVHRAQQRGMMQELLGKTLQVFTCAAEGGRGRQRWTVRVPTDEGGNGESDKRGYKESQEGHHVG